LPIQDSRQQEPAVKGKKEMLWEGESLTLLNRMGVTARAA